MRNQEIKNANYKTGVKILTEEQMQAGLPTYDLLLSKIEMQMVDMLLTSLYNYKVNHKENRHTVIVDEIKDLNLTNSGSINVMLRKQKLVMLLASQEYSDDNGFIMRR